MPSLKLRLKLTSKCYNGCEYCYEKFNECNNDMSFETFRDILEKIHVIFVESEKFNRMKIALTGGDPTLCESFGLRDAIKEIRKIFDNSKLFITSDVTAKSDMDQVEGFVEEGGKIYVSLNNSDFDDIDKIVEKFRDSILMLLVVLNNKNMWRIKEICDWVVSRNLLVRFNPLYYQGFNREYEYQFKRACQIISESPINQYEYLFGCYTLDRKRYSYCGYGEDYFYCDESGYMYRCQLVRYSPLFHYRELDPLLWLPMLKGVGIRDKCSVCEVRNYCLSGGCIGISCKLKKVMIKTMVDIRNRVEDRNGKEKISVVG